MGICKSCGQTFGEENDIPQNPAEVLCDLFQKAVIPVDDSYLCRECRKERGMLNLMGFGE